MLEDQGSSSASNPRDCKSGSGSHEVITERFLKTKGLTSIKEGDMKFENQGSYGTEYVPSIPQSPDAKQRILVKCYRYFEKNGFDYEESFFGDRYFEDRPRDA